MSNSEKLVQYYFKRSTKENLRNVLVRYFSEEDVSESKTLLWENCQAILGARKASVARTIKEADATDIINGFEKSDRSPFDIPNYVSIEIDKIPKFAPEEMEYISLFERTSQFEQRLNILEGSMTANNDSIANLTTHSPTRITIQ